MVNAAGEISVLNAQGQGKRGASLKWSSIDGVGSDGKHMAAVTREQMIWSFLPKAKVKKCLAQSYTTPVVAGERVRAFGGSQCDGF